MRDMTRAVEKLEQDVERLLGQRAKQDRHEQAVLIKDLNPIITLNAPTIPMAAGATPTKAEFDALARAVNDITMRLTYLQETLRNRIIG